MPVENTNKETDTWALHGTMMTLGYIPQALQYFGCVAPQYRWVTEGVSLCVRSTTHYFSNYLSRVVTRGRKAISKYNVFSKADGRFSETLDDNEFGTLMNENE